MADRNTGPHAVTGHGIYIARNAVKHPPHPQAYAGVAAEDASRQAIELCRAAVATGFWLNLPEHLTALRSLLPKP